MRVRLDAIGQAIPAGHRLRVAVSTRLLAVAWPSPEAVTLTVHAGPASRLTLPVRPPRDDDAALPAFGPPESSAALEVETLRTDPTTRTMTRDLAGGAHEITFVWDVGGSRRLTESATEMDDTNVTTYRIVAGDPLSASVRCRCSTALGRGDWQTRVETDSRMTATASEFLVTHTLDAYEGEERVLARTWTLSFPRDGV